MSLNAPLPIITLEIRSLAETVAHAMALRHKELEEYLKERTEQITKEYMGTLEMEIRKHAKEKLNARVQNYFAWGKGGEALERIVEHLAKPLITEMLTEAGLTEAESEV